MSPKRPTALRLDTAILDAMEAIRDREGVPVTTQIEMAAREWLARRGVIVKKTARKRVRPRKRA